MYVAAQHGVQYINDDSNNDVDDDDNAITDYDELKNTIISLLRVGYVH